MFHRDIHLIQVNKISRFYSKVFFLFTPNKNNILQKHKSLITELEIIYYIVLHCLKMYVIMFTAQSSHVQFRLY